MSTDTRAAGTPGDAKMDPEGGRSARARDRLVIRLLVVSTFVVILNETLLQVAIPRFIVDFKIGAGTAQWLTSAFMLTMAVVIPITGFLLQRFNLRPVFITAMSLFIAGTLLAAVAPGFSVLLLARVIQATGTAVMFPLVITTVMTLVEPGRRGRMMGTISIVISVAPAIGPAISGLVLTVLSWRWLFILILPISAVALIVAVIRLRNITTPRPIRLDVLSVVLSAIGFGSLVFGISNLGTAQGADIASVGWLPLGAGIAFIALFVIRQLSLQKHDGALLDLRTFTSPTFTAAIVLMALMMIALYGAFIVLPIYMQSVLGLSVFQTGLLLLPGGLLCGFLSPFVGRYFDKHGPSRPLLAGTLLASATFFAMSSFGPQTSAIWPFVAFLSLNACLALLMTTLMPASLGVLEPGLYAHGSAILGTAQQVAGAAGVALLVTILSASQIHPTPTSAATVASTAAGVHWAFLVAAIISLVAVPIVTFVRVPKTTVS